MKRESEEAKTRKFLENLIENRRTQPTEQQQHEEMQERVRQQHESQQRRQLMGLLATRQSISSPPLSSAPAAAASAASPPRMNFAEEALRRVDEISGIRRSSSLGSSFTDIMPANRMIQWGSSIDRSRSLRIGSAGAASLYPSLNLNDPTLTTKGVVPWATGNKKNERQTGDLLRRHTSGLSSLAEAISRESAAGAAASRKKPPAAAKRRKTLMSVRDYPKLKDSRFFLPRLPSSATNPRVFKASMKSYKALWRSPMAVLVSPQVRKEMFCRKVARGRVKLQDNSRTLPPALPSRRP